MAAREMLIGTVVIAVVAWTLEIFAWMAPAPAASRPRLALASSAIPGGSSRPTNASMVSPPMARFRHH